MSIVLYISQTSCNKTHILFKIIAASFWLFFILAKTNVNIINSKLLFNQQIRRPLTMLCSVVTESRRKQLEYERSIGVNTRRSPKELSQGFVIYLFRDKESFKFPTHCFLNFKTNYWQIK